MFFKAQKQEDLDYWKEANVVQVNDFTKQDGKYVSIISPEEITLYDTQKSRKKITASYIKHKDSGKIEAINIEKYEKSKTGVEKKPSIWIELWPESVSTMQSFLDFLINSNLSTFQSGSRFYDKKLPIDQQTYQKLIDLTKEKDGKDLIKSFIETDFTQEDIVSIGYRRKEKEKFYKLLNEDNYISQYIKEENLATGISEEKVWQHFFNENKWIFWYGLDYRFLDILWREKHIGETNWEGANGAIADFLLGCTDFTVLVEIKKPSTPLFTNTKDRAGSWKISNFLIQAMSQVLSQKAAWQIKSASNPFINWKRISQQTNDCKVIMIIGRSTEYQWEDEENTIKKQTFQLLRRDSRNIEILTFDELYKRAEFIVR